MKLFFKLDLKNWQDQLSLFVGLLVFVVIVFQAYAFHMTFDEAYTYLHTGQVPLFNSIFKFRIANTHILNSILIGGTTYFFPYNDLAIRTPVILSGLVFILVAISHSKLYRNRFTLLGLLFCFYFFTHYFSLARGYAICATCLLLMLHAYKLREQLPKWLAIAGLMGVLAIYANYVAIPIVSIFGAYVFAVDLKFKRPPISFVFLTVLLGLFGYGIYGFLSVTAAGKPIYGALTDNFFEAIPADLVARFLGGYFTSRFTIQPEIMPYLTVVTPLFVVIGVAIVAIYFWANKKTTIGLLTYAIILLIYATSVIKGKPLPTGRVLVPLWPLLAISIVEVLDFCTEKIQLSKKWLLGVNLGVLLVLFINFVIQIPFSHAMEMQHQKWWKGYQPLANFNLAYSPVDVYYDITLKEHFRNGIRPEDIYYIYKERYHKTALHQLAQRIPSQTISTNGIHAKVYEKEKLILLNTTDTVNHLTFYRTVLLDEDTVMTDTLHISSVIITSPEQPLVFPFPTEPEGDAFILKSAKEALRIKVSVEINEDILPPKGRGLVFL